MSLRGAYSFVLGGIIFLTMLTSPQIVFAEFEQQSPTEELAEINRPVPPRYGPRLSPPQTDGYHQKASFGFA